MNTCIRPLRSLIILAIVTLLGTCGCHRESKSSCIANLAIIDGAKAELEELDAYPSGTVLERSNLQSRIKTWPVCPKGGSYSINPIGTPATCSIHGDRFGNKVSRQSDGK